MPGIPNPANINVIIGQPGNINVQMGSPTNPRVNTIDYGTRTLKSAPDLNSAGATDGEVIAYSANTGGFVLETLEAIALPGEIDGGSF